MHALVRFCINQHMKFELPTFTIHGLALATINLSTKFEVCISTHYEDTKGDTK